MIHIVNFSAQINGNPKDTNLYGIITVDTDDSEDSNVILYRANDENELRELVGKDFDPDNLASDRLIEDYGFIILPKLLGIIQ